MIIDAIIYNGEKECLDIRINELKDVVDFHVVVEADYTFAGKAKPLYYDIIYKGHKIIYCPFREMPNTGNAWVNESAQRNYLKTAIQKIPYYEDNIVIISDVDEIPSAEAIKKYKSEMGLTALQMDVFWYKINCLAEKQTWKHTRIMTGQYLKNSTPQEIRSSGYDNVMDNAGWHFSYLGDEDFIANKLRSFSHQEYNTPEFTNPEHLKSCIEKGTSIWGMSKFEFVPLDERFPKYIIDNQEKFKHLIHQLC